MRKKIFKLFSVILTVVFVMFFTVQGCKVDTDSAKNNNLKTGHTQADITELIRPGSKASYCSDLVLICHSNAVLYYDIFNFDDIPAVMRLQPVVFTIYNTNEYFDLTLSGNPLVILTGTDASSFTVNTQGMLSTIPPRQSTSFTIQLTASGYSGASLYVQVEIPNSACSSFIYFINCTDKKKVTIPFPVGANFSAPLTGYAAIALCGGGGGGGSGAGGTCILPAPYVTSKTCRGGNGGKGGGGYTATRGNYLMQHGVAYTVVLGSGGSGGKGGACGASGSNGSDGGATVFKRNGLTVFSAGGGKGGRGGSSCTSATAAAGAGGSCSAGGAGGAGGNGYYKTVTTGTPPYVTTQTTCVCTRGGNGSPGAAGNAVIELIGFAIP